jgi:hypothetical protein
MIEGRFNIVFAGRIVPGKTDEEVKHNLARLFKTQLSQIERLFSGSEVTIKKNLDYVQAMKYQSALKQAGALVLIKKIDDGDSAVAEQSHRSQTEPKLTHDQQKQADGARKDEGASSTDDGSDTPDKWSVAAPGARLPETEKPAPLPVPDLSRFSVAEPGVTLAPSKKQPEVEVDLSGLSLDEPGPMPASEPKQALVIEVPDLSVAPPGEKIPNAPDDKPKLNPDISHLRLE